MTDDRKAWEVMKDMVIELEHGTEDFSNPQLLKVVLERAMDVIEVATAVAMLAKDGIPALATMEQLQEAVAAFHDLSKPPMAQETDDIITLTDEDGNETEWTIATVVKVDDQDYALLTPLAEPTEGEESGLMIYRLVYNTETGEDELAEITEDGEYERVADAMLELLDAETDAE